MLVKRSSGEFAKLSDSLLPCPIFMLTRKRRR
jgi:hypothetical protein